MADQTVASLFTQSIAPEEIRMDPADREVLGGRADHATTWCRIAQEEAQRT